MVHDEDQDRRPAGARGGMSETPGIAAHDSGQRSNAPFLCYLIERAQGHTDLETLAEIVPAPEPAW